MELIMAQAVQPQVPLEPAPQFQEEEPNFVGGMRDHEVKLLQEECIQRHNKDGVLVGTLLGVASVVAGIFTFCLINGVIGAVLGFVAFLILANVFSSAFHGLRNQDYLVASKALEAMNFRQFIVQNRPDVSIETIVEVHKQYKESLASQVEGLRA